jgi:hypothetical protein
VKDALDRLDEDIGLNDDVPNLRELRHRLRIEIELRDDA